jgi:hypothetical protein
MSTDVEDYGFDGSDVTIGDSSVGNLTEFHYANTPATIRTSGGESGVTYHTFKKGLNNPSITVGFLGSAAPSIGSAVAFNATLNDGTSASLDAVVITQVRISGRRDGAIESRFTGRATPLDVASSDNEDANADVSFNGTTASFNGTDFGAAPNGLVSCTYEATCAEVVDSGAGDDSVMISPGLPDQTVTIEAMGGDVLDVGDVGSLEIDWNDGGNSCTESDNWVCMSSKAGGGVDDAITTEYTFKPAKASS